jgi:hypothetical protein
MKLANMGLHVWLNKSLGLHQVHFFRESGVQEYTFDVHVQYRLVVLDGQGNENANCCPTYNMRKSIQVIKSLNLLVTMGHKSSFVSECSVSSCLKFEDPFCVNRTEVKNKWDERPSVVTMDGFHFRLHGTDPLRIRCGVAVVKGLTKRLSDGGKIIGD